MKKKKNPPPLAAQVVLTPAQQVAKINVSTDELVETLLSLRDHYSKKDMERDGIEGPWVGMLNLIIEHLKTQQKEIEELREGIRKFRVAWGHHLPEGWAEHFDKLVEPDPLWKALDQKRREER